MRRVAVKSGVSDNGNVEITNGLPEDTPVVSIIKNSPAPGTAVQTPVPPKN